MSRARAVSPPRAAQYLRMSREHQRYSAINQAAAIAVYAAERDIPIVRTYSDEGKSGLTLKERPGLQALLSDVLDGRADFNMILALDVSRWGRFQDPDQSAHYEFICREAGVRVEYCGEQFENDGSFPAVIMKHLKRTMAAEFSRDLSTKVASGKRRIAGLGYRVGGPAGYGLRRVAISESGRRLTLGPYEYKGAVTDRMILVPGPQEEVEIVRRIFRLYVVGGLNRTAISRLLNVEGILAENGAKWTRPKVHWVLTSEKYVGVGVYGRTIRRLKEPSRNTPRESWIRVEGAFEPIVNRELFDEAQCQIQARSHHMTDDEILEALKRLLTEKGKLTQGLVDDCPYLPCYRAVVRRFGGLKGAYRRIGYVRRRSLPRRHWNGRFAGPTPRARIKALFGSSPQPAD
jgi:DNA invertase Pin-like site-specific DNA recombinase